MNQVFEVETSERTCKSGDVRDSRPGHAGGHSGTPWVFEGQVRVDMRHVCSKIREENALGTGHVNLLEEVGSKARV